MKLDKDLDNDCYNEKQFIKNLRLKLSNSLDLIKYYTNLFDSMIDNFKNDSFKSTFTQILKHMGSVRTILKQFAKERKFQPEYLNEFLENIKENIRKNKRYVGQIEVENVVEMLEDCKIIVYIFTNYKNAVKIIEKEKNEKNSIYIILDQDGEHYEYIKVNKE